MGTTDTFSELIERGRLGDSDALRLLAEQYEREVRIVARVLLGPALRPYLDSIDLVQSIHRSLIVGLQENKYDLSTPENLIALALTMVRRKVARHWRRLRRQKRLDGTFEPRHNHPELLESLPSHEADPADTAEYQDEREHLFEHLADCDKQMLDMRSQGYTTGEVAKKLGISDVALRVRLTRLKRRLQTMDGVGV